MRQRQVKRGTRIYDPGDPSDQIFLIRRGLIKLSTTAPDGREIILTFLYPGDIFGETALVDDSPRDHAAEAADDCVVCAMRRETILRAMREAPEIGAQITEMIVSRLRSARFRIEALLSKSAHVRLAHALLELAERHGLHDTDGVIVPLRLTQGELARFVGLTRETVNAILQEWREQGLLETDRRSIRLRDPDQLRALVSRPAAQGTASEPPR